MPARIETLEAEQADIQRALADGTLYSSDAARAALESALRVAMAQRAGFVMVQPYEEYFGDEE